MSATEEAGVKYWIDTDPGVDDAMAIILALREVGNRLIGFSTVQGNAPEPVTARNLARIVHAARAGGIAQADWRPVVARGSGAALLARSSYVREPHAAYHGRDGLANVTWTPSPDWNRDEGLVAAQAIIDHASQSPGLRLFLIGPLTNIALAIRLAPDLPKLVDAVAIMGGSLRAGGNETIAAEFNFAVDPEAAQIVLQAGFKDLRLIPIDACDDVKLSLKDLEHIATLRSPAARLVSELATHWRDLLHAGHGVPIYDAVAWCAVNHPGLLKWEPIYVAVDTGNGLAHGASLADWRRRTGNAPNVQAATGVKVRAEFFELFFSLLS